MKRFALLGYLVLVANLAQVCTPVHSKTFSPLHRKNMQPITKYHETQEFQLSNGLKVLIREDHTAPVFTQIIYFRVGSRNDPKGISGISHYLEHMQFNGTESRPKGAISQGIESRGGSFNAATSTDYTMYYMTLPSGNLDFSLELEADRMRNSIVEQAEANREKKVVLAELSGGENNPLTLIYREMMKQVYPTHPYGIPIIGWEEEVKKIGLEDLRTHYDTFYQPDNAVLVLVGDIDTQSALKKIGQTFGQIPVSNVQIPEVKAEKAPISRHTVELNFPTESSYVDLAFRAVDFKDADYAPLSALSAVLTNGSLSRLEKALVDSGKASYVSSSVRQGIDPFCFNILAVTDPGGDLEEIETTIRSEIQKVIERGVTEEELERVKAKSETGFLFGIEDSEGLANQLGFFEVVSGDWKRTYSWTEELNAIGVEDIRRVAQNYLTPQNMVSGKLRASAQGSSSTPGTLELPDHANYKTKESASQKDEVGASTLRPAIKGVHATNYTLNNGLKVILRQNHSNPVIAINGYVDAGEVFDQAFGKLGASTLTAMMLDRGTKSHSRDQLNNTLELIGGEIELNPETDYVSINARGRARDLPKMLGLLGEELQTPLFLEEELKILKTQILSELAQSKDDFKVLGKIALHQALYPKDHPYHEFSLPQQIEGVTALTSKDLKDFHERYYRPERTTLVLSGDFESDDIIGKLEQVFGSWQSDQKPQPEDYQVKPPIPVDKGHKQVVEVPGKSQASVIFGQVGTVKRSDPDFYALLVANDILGGGSTLSSRLGSKVREEAGLVYSIYSQFQMGRAPGPFSVKMGVAPDKVEEAIKLTKAELRRFAEAEITEEELSRAKNYRKGLFVSQNLTSNAAVASALNQYSLVGLDLETINHYPELIESVSKEDVQRVIKAYLHPDQMEIIILRPSSVSSK